MKKILCIITILIIFIALGYSSKNKVNSSLTNNNDTTDKSIENKEELDIFKILPTNINMLESNYNDMVKLYGKPKNITKFKDENLIKQKGYFTDIIYNNMDFIIYSYDNEKPYNLLKNNKVIQIDFYGDNFFNGNKIKIGDLYDTISKKYKTDELTYEDLNNIKQKLNTFRNDNTYNKYNKILSITTQNLNKLPITTVLLFNQNNVLERVSYINLTAD